MIEISSGITVVSSSRPQSNVSPSASLSHSDPQQNRSSRDDVSLSAHDISFASRQSKNDIANISASTIREANKIMDDVANIVGQKREEILQYEKIYPPFQNKDSERVERLMSIPAFKKQLDALMLVESTDQLSEKITEQLSDTSSRNEFFADVENFQIPSHDKENGPDLASHSVREGDQDVRLLGQELASIVNTLGTIQAGVGKDIQSITSTFTAAEEKMGVSMLRSEQEAKQKSEEVRQELATSQEASIGHEQARTLLENLK